VGGVGVRTNSKEIGVSDKPEGKADENVDQGTEETGEVYKEEVCEY